MPRQVSIEPQDFITYFADDLLELLVTLRMFSLWPFEVFVVECDVMNGLVSQ